MDAVTSLFVALDRSSSTSLQAQICDGVRRAVASAVLAPGTRLPSARVLAVDLAVSRTTVVAAIEQLAREGYLTSRARSGTFVADELPADPPKIKPPALSLSGLRLSRQAEALAHETRESGGPGLRAFRLSRPALELFPVREWNRLLARRAGRLSPSQLDYGHESPELRTVIAEAVSASRGMVVHRDQVLLFGGGQRALDFAATALLDPGDRAWIEAPGYRGARRALQVAGATVVPVPVDADGLVVADGIAAAPDARLVYTTPSCQFPLGVATSLGRRMALLAWASSADAGIVEDDYDTEFRYAGPPIAALHGLDRSGRVLYVNSFSRTTYPSLRLGYLIAPSALVDRLRAVRATLDEQLPSLVQLTLADFVAEGHFARHVRRMKVVYRERCDTLLASAAALGVRVRPVVAGLHAIVDLPPGTDAERVTAAAGRRGIEVAPLSRFGGHGEALVLGFGAVVPDRIPPAMESLAAAIAEVAC